MSDVILSYSIRDKDYPEKKIYTLPLPTQQSFHLSDAHKKVYFGGYGSGKSTCLSMEILLQSFKYPRNFGVLARKYLSELKQTTLKELLEMCQENIILEHNKSDRIITFVNYSSLYYTGIDASDGGLDKIKSLNLGWAALDEVTECSEDAYLALLGRLRKQLTSRQFFGATNSAGKDWAWKRFVGPNKDIDAESFVAITSENKYLPDDYLDSLMKTYPKDWIDRYVYCGFSDFSGVVFNEYHEQIHVLQNDYIPHPTDNIYIGYDWGIRNPAAILWISVGSDGKIIVFDEFYEKGKLISDLAQELKRNNYYERASQIVADKAIWITESSGRRQYDDWVDLGIYWTPSNSELSQGILKMNQMFKDEQLFISPRCKHLIEEMGNYKWPDLKPWQQRNYIEKPVDKDNHAIAALRYVINSIDIPKVSVQMPKWYEDFKLRHKKKQNENYSNMAL